MKIGPYHLTALETGDFALDGGAMFGVVPRTLWQKKIPADERNRIDLALRVLLIESSSRRILVDTGIGAKWSDRDRDIFKVSHERKDLERALVDRGLGLGDITDVILTHLHFDHAGGATREGEGGRLEATFPNARYYVQRENLEWALNPTEKDRASYLRRDFEPLLEQGRLSLVEGEIELFPGISVRVSHGHTTGLQMPIVTDGERTLVYAADLIPTSAHIPVPWVMAYDLRPLVSMNEKKALYELAVPGGWFVFFEHDPRMDAATVVETERGFAVGEAVSLRDD